MFTPLFLGSAIFFFVILIGLGIWTYTLQRRIKKLTTGTNGKNLEDAIYQLMEDHTILQHRIETTEQTNARISHELKTSIRGVAAVRYNAFSDVGGKQSFATAFINEQGTGVVISSLYARDRVNVYAKPIQKFASEYELTREESKALKEASESFIK